MKCTMVLEMDVPLSQYVDSKSDAEYEARWFVEDHIMDDDGGPITMEIKFEDK